MSGFVPTEDERTTEVGLYHYARSYRAAADFLANGPDKNVSTHPSAPRDFLYAHAIELYLKAFLRLQGNGAEELRKTGHNIPKLATQVMGYGVTFDFDVARVFELLTYENIFGVRYIKTGSYTRATTDGLKLAADTLHRLVKVALRERGRLCAD